MNLATGIVFDRSLFFRNLADASQRVLLANYDGILAPLTVERQHAFPYPTVPELLDSLMTTCYTRVVLLTSRSAHELAFMLGLDPSPEIWGCGGFERLLPDGRYQSFALDDHLKGAIDTIQRRLESEGLGALVQRNPNGIVVKWGDLATNDVTEASSAANRALWAFEPYHSQLRLRRWEGGLELHALTRDNNDVVRHVLTELHRDTVVAYLGNCGTDEGAFRAIAERGLGVLVCPEFRGTAAQLWLQPPEDVSIFLSDWILACRGVL